jgi:hypothetical protein
MVAKKTSATKAPAKKAASRKTAAKKTVAKKTLPTKAATKKTATKKTATKKPATRKAATKKTTTPPKPAKKTAATAPVVVPASTTPVPTANVPAAGFSFANPSQTADDYGNFTKADVFADSSAKPSTQLQPVPAPWKTPPVLQLSDVLGAAAVTAITAANSITFHSVGDTGGIHDPSKQFAVADAMANDLGTAGTYAKGLPAFFFHLGDVVYYLGQEPYYYEQFYDPYRDYDAPIFAIPGNHDGMISPSVKQTTLQGFLENFCTQTPSKNPEAQGFSRTTMIQPGVYFTLRAPFVDIIGLYSNISEGATEGVISGSIAGPAQLAFLQQQLTAIATERKAGTRKALIFAVHHPPFTGSQDHAPSPTMLKQIDAACTAAGILPDMFLSGHAHLYERYTRTVNNSQIPFIVAGMGGYWNLSGMKKGTNNQPPTTPFTGTDASGNKLVLEKFNNTTFGYLRLTVSPASIAFTFYAVTPGIGGQAASTSVADQFTLDLNQHTVT